MGRFTIVRRALMLALKPLSDNKAFFFFMYLLGCVCAWATLPDVRGARLYEHLYAELFVDVYVLCVLLAFLPRRVMVWVRGFVYALLYASSLADVYCFVKFQCTLTPSMLMLMGETNAREAGEFLRSCVSADVIMSEVGWVLLVMLLHVLSAMRLRFPHFVPRRWREYARRRVRRLVRLSRPALPVLSLCVMGALVACVTTSWHNKRATARLFSGRTIGEVEHTLTEKNHAVLYLPVWRLAFSVYANGLAARQIDRLVAVTDKVRVDSCSYRSPNIVVIIGESYNRHHSSQYGYVMPTTPRQKRLERQGRLVRYTDVVSSWNLTSFVFKHLFSLYTVGDKGEWCDYPLFPTVFRKAGYHVTFVTNQFLPKAKEAVYDFSGGFFLNNPKLSASQFDARNATLHAYDEELLQDYASLGGLQADNNLVIFHLIGQHVSYRQRYPKDRKRFTADDYVQLKPHLNARERGILADYDNAVLYNDSVVAEIVGLFEHEDAIVIYVPDHGEECFEGDMHFFCRMHSAKIDARLAHAEFDVPFWIWCSRKYIKRRPEVFRQIVNARGRRYMTDALPHMLLWLGGISCPYYNDRRNILSPDYDEQRPRLLKATTDYDSL